MDYNDTWFRDFGPITVIEDNQPLLLDFQFNGWGNRYDASLDNLVTQRLEQKQYFNAPLRALDLFLEGGSIDSNGSGTLLTTESCLLNNNRNSLGKPQTENALKKHLGAQNLLWLKHGFLEGDDTDGHIDNLARFVSHDTIVYLTCSNPSDEHYSSLKTMQHELAEFRQANGKPYRLVPLPLPTACYSRIDHHRLPASYINFLIINHAVLIPTFDCPADNIAQQTLQQCFPDRAIVPINSKGFIEQNGGIHCLTMQLPQGTLNKTEKTMPRL
jgi:agmatine deiminase